MAQLSLLGLMATGTDLFLNMVVPDGIDKELVTDNILMETAELEVLYADPDFMQFAIGAWSKKELATWTRMWAAMQLDYNPIENYDRYEEWTDDNTVNRSNTDTTKSSTNTMGTSKDSVSETGNQTDTESAAAYNDSNFSPTTKLNSVKELGRNADTTDITNTSGSVENSGGSVESAKNNRKGRAHGNIGVTTSQQMIEAELELAKFNVINYIVNQFRQRFCLLVY